jgi:hypothetical protein
MLKISEYRKKFPKYDAYDDETLTQHLYNKYGQAEGHSYEEYQAAFADSGPGAWQYDPSTMGVGEKSTRVASEHLMQAIPSAVKDVVNKPIGAILRKVDEGLNYIGINTPISEWWHQKYVQPVEERERHLQEWQAKSVEDEGFWGTAAINTAGMLGGLAPTIAADIATGFAAEAASLGHLGAKATGYLSKIPRFASGMGLRKMMQGSARADEEGGGVLDVIKTGFMQGGMGVAEGLLMHKVGALGAPKVSKDIASGAMVQSGGVGAMGRAGYQIPGQAAVATGLGSSEIIGHEGRLPTLEEVASMAVSGAAIGGLFAAYPVPFEIASKRGPKRVRRAGSKDAVAIRTAIERYGGMEEVVDVVETDTGVIIEFPNAKTEIVFVDKVTPAAQTKAELAAEKRMLESGGPALIDVERGGPRDSGTITTTHRGTPSTDVRGGKMVDTGGTEMPGRTLVQAEPNHIGESTGIPKTPGVGPGGTIEPLRSPWVPDTEMDPRSEGTAGKPTLQAPKPKKLKTTLVERAKTDMDALRKRAQELYGKEKEQEQLRLFQDGKQDFEFETPVPDKEVVRRTQEKKDHLKFVLNTAMKHGDIRLGEHVRTTTVSDLEAMMKTGALRIGKDLEGRAGISAHELVSHEMAQDLAVYGPYSDAPADHPIAIIAPASAKEGIGVQPNEVLLNPHTPPSELKFIIAGVPKVLELSELPEALSELRTNSERAEGKRFFQEGDGETPDNDAETFLDMFLPQPKPENYAEINGREGFTELLVDTYGPTKGQLKAQLTITDAMGSFWVDLMTEQGHKVNLDDFYKQGFAGGHKIMGADQVEGLPRGAVDIMRDGRAVIYALKDPDFSTAIHEPFHVAKRMLEQIDPMAARVIESEYGVKNGYWSETQNEAIAKDFERWLLTGQVSNPAIEGMFSKVKRFMLKVYKKATGMDVEVNPEVAKVFNRWLGGEAEIRADANRIVELTRAKKGVTYNVATGRSLEGDPKYAVGVLPGKTETVRGELTNDTIQSFIEKHEGILADPRFNVGTWVNPEGETVLDISVALPEQWKAVALAKRFNQSGAFDIAAEKYMPTGGTGENLGTTIADVEAYLNELDSDVPVRLVRYMKQDSLTELDPNEPLHRTGIKGEELQRLKGDVDAPTRLHYYTEGEAEEPNVAQLPYKYETEIPSKKLYPLAEDPLNLSETAILAPGMPMDWNTAEALMKQEGYWGYRVEGGRHPSTNVIFEQLPAREQTSYYARKALEGMGIDVGEMTLKDLNPKTIQAVGELFDIDNLGPINPPTRIPYEGGEILVPGGLDGRFTWLDMFWLKARGYNPNEIPEHLHVALQEKMARSMMPKKGDHMQVYNNILFGMLSQSAPLTPNEFGYARARSRGMEDVQKMADYTQQLPEFPTKSERSRLNKKIRQDLGMSKLKEGGIGFPGTQDMTRVAEFARLFLQDPEFFNKRDSETWVEFTERIGSQVGGVKTKIAAFGGVWQDPVGATIGAADRHIIRRTIDALFTTKKEKSDFSKKMIDSWNDGKLQRKGTAKIRPKITYKDGFEAILDNQGYGFFADYMVKFFLPDMVEFRLKDGTINPKVPEHLKNTDWIQEPKQVGVTSEFYTKAMDQITGTASERGLGVFANQWMEWDRERGRLETHEVMFPGLYKMPRQSMEDALTARKVHKEAGYLAARGGVSEVQADMFNTPWQRMLYYQIGELKSWAKGRNFNNWFGKSKVTQETVEGVKPLIVYHGTDADFSEFAFGDTGFHMGTQEQAYQFVKRFGKAHPGAENLMDGNVTMKLGANIKPVYAKLENPARMRDVGGWDNPHQVTAEMHRKGFIETKQKADSLAREANKRYESLINTGLEPGRMIYEMMEPIRNHLEKQGHDGIVYSNTAEGPGDSYIAFHPEQIKSQFNKGTWDASNRDTLFQKEMGPPENAKELLLKNPEEIESELELRLNELGRDEFMHLYGEGKVGPKVQMQYAKERGITAKEAGSFLREDIVKYKAIYDNLVAKSKGRSPEENFDYIYGEERLFQSKKERRLKAEGREHMKKTVSPPPPPSANKSILQKYEEMIDTQLGDKLVNQKIIPLLERMGTVGEGIIKAVKRDYRGTLKDAPEYVEGMDEMKHWQALGHEFAVGLGKRLSEFTEHEQLQMGDVLRGTKEMESLPAHAKTVTQEAHQMLIQLGKQSTELGLLSEEVFFKNYGKYFPRLYTEKEYKRMEGNFGVTKPNRMDMSRFMKRGDIPKELREEWGEIMTPGYPVAKAIAQITHDIEMAKMAKGIALNPDWAVPQETRRIKNSQGRWKTEVLDLPDAVKQQIHDEGFVQLPASKKLGALNGAWVHPEIAKDFETILKVDSAGMRTWKKALGSWKFGKVILSPKTHIRNVFSNSILAHLGGMPMYEQPAYLIRAFGELRDGGKYFDMGKSTGLLDATWTKGELMDLFNNLNVTLPTAKAHPNQVLEIMGKIITKAKVAGGKAAKLYESEEQLFKLAKMIHNIEERGMEPSAAAKDAEKWLFNYSKLTRFQEKFRTSPLGAPFATFAFKSIPRVAEAAIKYPHRFALPIAMMKGIEAAAQYMIGDTDEEERAKKEMAPEWMQGGFPEKLLPNFVRFPLVDDAGREYYLNLTYLMPWGDLGEGGGFGPIPGSLMPFTQPMVKDAWQQFANYDMFWKQPIVKEEDVAGKTGIDRLIAGAGARGKNLASSLLPTPVMDIGKLYDAADQKPDYKGRMRSPVSVGLDVGLGIKTYPVDYVEQIERKAMELDPTKGIRARELKSKIKSATRRKAAMRRMGKGTEYYDKKIQAYIEQIRGLAEELKEEVQTFRKTGM